MPEVCEVALLTQLLNLKLDGKKIRKMEVLSGRYKKNPTKLKGLADFKPCTCESINSKGKFILFSLTTQMGNPFWMMSTLGMTGMWKFTQGQNIRIKFSGEIPFFYYDQRNFGTLQITFDKTLVEKKLKSLAPDALRANYDWRTIAKVQTYHQKLVEILMDQKKVVSGLGNYLTAEIMYRAKLSPYRTGHSLTEEDVKRLTKAIKYITKRVYLNNYQGYMRRLDPEIMDMKRIDYHPEIKINGNEEYRLKIYRQKVDPKGNPVRADKILKGRSTYWVPAVQK